MKTFDVLNRYTAVQIARELTQRATPVINAILAHDRSERLTPCQIGEEIMGKEKYHEKYVHWDGTPDEYLRSNEARKMTNTIAQVFRKLCQMGYMTRHEAIDESKTVQVEEGGFLYFDEQGRRISEYVEVYLSNGQKAQITADCIKGVVRQYDPCLKKEIHPKYAYYTFN